MRPLKRSNLPLVWGRRGLIRRCSIRLSEQTRSKAWLPVGWRSPVAQKRSVNALPLSVRTLLMMKGALSIRRLRKPPAEVAESPRTDPAGGAINGGEQVRALVRVRHPRQILHVFTSTCTKPGS